MNRISRSIILFSLFGTVALPQPEVMAWGSVTGLRVNGKSTARSAWRSLPGGRVLRIMVIAQPKSILQWQLDCLPLAGRNLQ